MCKGTPQCIEKYVKMIDLVKAFQEQLGHVFGERDINSQ